jgi:FkbM family methyltransferase
MRPAVGRTLDRAGVGRAARWAWTYRPGTGRHRRFHAWLAEADRLDNERMRLVLASALRHDSNCIDIGAGTGDILEDIVRIAPDGNHIAYEAVPSQIAKLRERFPDVDARNVAVSDMNGQISFVHVTDQAEWSGLRDYDQIGGAPKQTLTVPAVRLDDDLPASYIPACVKIDVNGAERQVLEGAINTLSTHRPTVLIEHGLAAADYGTTPEMVFDLLHDACGMEIFDLTGNGPLNAQEFLVVAKTRWNFLAHPG